jgi:hypothetical protein
MLLERDYLPIARAPRQHLAEGSPYRVDAAVQQHQRRTRRVRGAVELAVDFEAVDGGIVADLAGLVHDVWSCGLVLILVPFETGAFGPSNLQISDERDEKKWTVESVLLRRRTKRFLVC